MKEKTGSEKSTESVSYPCIMHIQYLETYYICCLQIVLNFAVPQDQLFLSVTSGNVGKGWEGLLKVLNN